MKQWIACIMLTAALCCACSSHSTNMVTESTDAETAERTGLTMENEKIMDMITEMLGDGAKDFAQILGTEYSNFSGRFFVKIRVLKGKEADAEAWLEGVCGEGYDAATFSTPAFKNHICDDLRSMQPVKEYIKVRPGENGAKTETTKVITATDKENTLYIYILGL